MVAESPSWNGKQLAVYLIAFVLAIGPFFNGMFFEPIRLVGVALACVAYWLWYTGKSDTNLSWNGLDLAVLAWFSSYMLVSINPVVPRGHLSVVLDMVSFLAVYTVVRFGPRLEQSLGRILVGAGVVMVTISVARWAGVTWLDRHVVDLVINGRLSGGFQYPNTFAVWLFCLVLLTLKEARTPRLGNLFLMIGGLFAGAFMLTLSRGALVAAPVAYLAILVFGSKTERLFTAWTGLLTWGPAFVLGSAALRAFQQEQHAVALLALAACALPPLAAPYLVKLTEFLWERKRTWGMAFVSILLLGSVWAAPKVARELLPVVQKMTDNRITSGYDRGDLSIFTRLMFDKYAWRIMSTHHLWGAGGRAWTKLYRQVQTFPYFTTEVHNHFLQTGVEAGVIGMLAFAAILALCLTTAWRSRKQQPGDTTLTVWVGIVTYIGIHSAFDFDLSYISLLLLLAVAAGVISSRSTAGTTTGRQWVQRCHSTLAAMTLLTVIAAGSLYVSNAALLASDQAWTRGDIPGTVAKLQLARWTDPLNAEPLRRMASLKATTGAGNSTLPDEKVLLAKVHSLDAYDPPTTLDLAGVALQEQRWAQAFDLAMEADSLIPLDQDLNAAATSMMWTAVSGAINGGDLQLAHALAVRMKAYEVVMNLRFNQAAPYETYARAHFGHTGTTHMRIGQGLIVTHDYAAAAEHLRAAVQSPSDKAEAELWLFVALDLDGKKPEAEKLLQENPKMAEFLKSDLYRNVLTAAMAG